MGRTTMQTMTRAALVAAALLPLSPPADAQPRFEVAGGVHYGFQRPPVQRDWLVSGSLKTRSLDYVVEVARFQREEPRIVRENERWIVGFAPARSLQVSAGVRGRLMAERRLTPFYQGLVGVLTFSPSRESDRLTVLGPWNLGQSFLLQPGAGLDVAIQGGLKVRLAADLLMLVEDGHLHSVPRVSIGAVVQF